MINKLLVIFFLHIFILFSVSVFAKDVYYNLEVTSFNKKIDGKNILRYKINGSETPPIIRANKGDILHITLHNKTNISTTIHWHGVLLPEDMDGVVNLVAPNKKFVYSFRVKQVGTYWYHAHGLEEAQGIYGGIIFNDKNKISEGNLLLYSGILGDTPNNILNTLNPNAIKPKHAGHSHLSTNNMNNVNKQNNAMDHDHMDHTNHNMNRHYADVSYIAHTINGQTDDDYEEDTYKIATKNINNKPLKEVKLRIVNAYVDGYLNFVYSGGKIKIIATDGIDIKPLSVDNLKVAMGETYDVILNIDDADSSYELIAFFMGTNLYQRVIIGNTNNDGDLKALANYNYLSYGISSSYDNMISINNDKINFTKFNTIQNYDLELNGDHNLYNWGFDINGNTIDTLSVKQGDKVIFKLKNNTDMDHPMHLHGNFFKIKNTYGDLIKHTINLEPNEEITIEFIVDTQGKWLFHCHNLFHMLSGMNMVVDVN